jgi:hypothetical protein
MASGFAFFTIMLRRASWAAKGCSAAGNGSSGPASRWFGIQPAERWNQKWDSCVSTSPFRGIPFGITQSNALMRSVATNR